MADLSSSLAQFSDAIGGGVTFFFSFLSNLATAFALATGLASLFFGRRLFWVFVATIGFIIGVRLAPMIYPYLPELTEPFHEIIGLALALVLAGTALVMQRLASIIFGAVTLGIIGYTLGGSMEAVEWVQWFFAALFGLGGGLLLYFFFDWTLIAVSVLLGAAITIYGARETGGLPDDFGLWLFGLLLLAGLIYQGNDLRISARLRSSTAAKQQDADAALPVAPQLAADISVAQQPAVKASTSNVTAYAPGLFSQPAHSRYPVQPPATKQIMPASIASAPGVTGPAASSAGFWDTLLWRKSEHDATSSKSSASTMQRVEQPFRTSPEAMG